MISARHVATFGFATPLQAALVAAFGLWPLDAQWWTGTYRVYVAPAVDVVYVGTDT